MWFESALIFKLIDFPIIIEGAEGIITIIIIIGTTQIDLLLKEDVEFLSIVLIIDWILKTC